VAAERVKRSVSRFITDRLKLVVNEEKSEVSRPWCSKYLGFRITRFGEDAHGHPREEPAKVP
jgi:RNA-directed DNA polymerase